MAKTKKVAIYLPFYQDKPKKGLRLLSKDEVRKIEKNLKASRDIEYLGNVDFRKVKVSRNKFICNNVNLEKVDLFFWYALGMRKRLDYLKKYREK
jgi:hypothetical protein